MSDSSSTPSPGRSRWLLWIGILIGVFAAFQFLPVQEWLQALQGWIQSLGYWGPVVFVILYILTTVFLLPGAAMTPLAGLLFGLGWGTLWVVIGSNIGASIAFLVGRYLARDAVARKIEGYEKFAAVDRAVGEGGWKIVMLTRLSPAFPFVLLNYAYGLTRVKWIHYAFASLIGMFPGTVMYVYFGSLGDLAAQANGVSTAKIVLYIVAGIATIAVTLLITRNAKRALAEKAHIESE